MSLTGANAVVMLSIPDLYPAPQRLQQFAADDIFDAEMVKMMDTVMGVDGNLSAGFVFVERKQTITLQGNSPSNDIFDNWAGAMGAQTEAYPANGLVTLKAIRKKFTLTKGFLTGYTYMPSVKRLVQPRKYEITWNIAVAAPA